MHDRIAIDSMIQHGKPVIRGTRIPVVRIVGGLAGGMSVARGRLRARQVGVPAGG